MKRNIIATGLVALAARASAQLSTFCPASDVCYKLNIPQSTASSGTGDIFFQISAPTSYEWVALGLGRGMAGANIFVVYTSQSGNNVTLSPRLGSGHVMPTYTADTQAFLLEGSGVKDGKMVANVRCSNCNKWNGGTADFTSNDGNWIYAFQSSGGPKNQDSTSAGINEHTDKSPFRYDYSAAKGGNSVNPLLSTNGGSSNGTSSGGASAALNDGSSNKTKMVTAHATLAALAFVIFFPAGAIAVRLASFPGVIWFHAAFQAFAYLVYIAAFGLGVSIANDIGKLDNYHPVIGIVVFAGLFFQPVMGLLHHSHFKKIGSRGAFSHLHVWLGRALITLGIINGGLGFKLAKAEGDTKFSNGGMIAYAVIAAVMWLAWVAASIMGERRRGAAATVAGSNGQTAQSKNRF